MTHPASGAWLSVFVGKNTFRNRWVVSTDSQTRTLSSHRDKEKAKKAAIEYAKRNRPAEVVLPNETLRYDKK